MCTEVPDADFLVTSRNPDFMFSANVVNAICVDCLIKLGLAMFAQQQDEAVPVPEPEPEPAPKRRPKPVAAGEGEVHTEAQAAHVNS